MASDPIASAPPLAARYEALASDRHLQAGRRLADRLALRPGDRVLELDCGTGLLADELARRVGPGGDVLGLDPLPLHVHLAYQWHDRRNLRFQIGEAAGLARFPAGCFDVVIANGVLPRWSDPPAVLVAARRLLAPGGRLGLAVRASLPPHPAAVARDLLQTLPAFVAHAAPPAQPAGRAADAASLAALLAGAGFAPVDIDTRIEHTRYPHAAAAIEALEAEQVEPLLAHLPVYLRAPARAAMQAHLDAQSGPDGIVHDVPTFILVAGRGDDGP